MAFIYLCIFTILEEKSRQNKFQPPNKLLKLTPKIHFNVVYKPTNWLSTALILETLQVLKLNQYVYEQYAAPLIAKFRLRQVYGEGAFTCLRRLMTMFRVH